MKSICYIVYRIADDGYKAPESDLRLFGANNAKLVCVCMCACAIFTLLLLNCFDNARWTFIWLSVHRQLKMLFHVKTQWSGEKKVGTRTSSKRITLTMATMAELTCIPSVRITIAQIERSAVLPHIYASRRQALAPASFFFGVISFWRIPRVNALNCFACFFCCCCSVRCAFLLLPHSILCICLYAWSGWWNEERTSTEEAKTRHSTKRTHVPGFLPFKWHSGTPKRKERTRRISNRMNGDKICSND